MLKFITLAVAGILTIAVVRRVIETVNASRAQVKSKPAENPAKVTSLRQDPESGIYFPED